VQLRPGYHVNSNTPSDEYLIPLKLSWDASPLQTLGVEYPKPRMEKYQFSEKPLSVFTGDFDIATKFKAAPNAPNGMAIVSGKLRYQACTDKMCLPPKTASVTLTADIQ
jgi:thiol:disulfide interchange protein DsbD